MELALYAPGLGYYSAGSTKLGPSGDFVTAPELGGLFGRALARTLRAELAGIAAPVILELGAGTGALAAQILDALADLERRRYLILEPSADLRERQRRALARFARSRARGSIACRPSERGAVVANEVLDALPVSRFAKRGARVVPRGVVEHGDGFAWADGPERATSSAAVDALERALGAPLAGRLRERDRAAAVRVARERRGCARRAAACCSSTTGSCAASTTTRSARRAR